MKTVICDSRLPSAAKIELETLGFRVIPLPPDGRLPSPIGSHTDMLIFRYGGTIITEGRYLGNNAEVFYQISESTGVSVLSCDEVFSNRYPFDAILNALVIGKRLFIKSDTASKSVIALAEREGLKIHSVKQGYPACTVLPLGDGAAITADRGIAQHLGAAGVRVTLISNSDEIKLPPYGYGFIGGCCGRYGDTVYFIGDLDAHPDSDIIKASIADAGLNYRSLMPNSGALFDLGGLVFCD